jgi:hypothetical protein
MLKIILQNVVKNALHPTGSPKWVIKQSDTPDYVSRELVWGVVVQKPRRGFSTALVNNLRSV